MTPEKIKKAQQTALRSEPILTEFVQYCKKYPQQRFWQALRNFARVQYILVVKDPDTTAVDTFYWEGKNE